MLELGDVARKLCRSNGVAWSFSFSRQLNMVDAICSNPAFIHRHASAKECDMQDIEVNLPDKGLEVLFDG